MVSTKMFNEAVMCIADLCPAPPSHPSWGALRDLSLVIHPQFRIIGLHLWGRLAAPHLSGFHPMLSPGFC